MNGAMLLQAWADTLVTTGLLVAVILLIRKPFARHFGARLAYMLWLVPALRLFLPPLPFADPAPVVPAIDPAAAEMAELLLLADAADVPAEAAVPLWSMPDLLPYLFALWAIGFVGVLVATLSAHRRFLNEVLRGSVELEPVGSIRLVMSEAVNGPVAFGLLRRCVAVPLDFFGRYAATERALAIDHELAHHRHGDLWANAAALLLLAAQWFNPFAWRAIRAFRFDQEAACDARVLTMSESAMRPERTAQYATAIAKAAMGSRLSLAAPMAVHDNLQERLTMLTKEDISKRRGLVGRMLVGTAALGVLATTATLVPADAMMVSVQDEPDAELAAPPAPPAPPAAVAAPAPPAPPAPLEAGEDRPRVVVIRRTTRSDADAARGDKDGARTEIHQIITTPHGTAPKAPKAERVEFRLPGSLSREEILATLKEQGVKGAKAEAIADKLEAKRKERFQFSMAPMPPLPPMPPMPTMPPEAIAALKGKSVMFAKCGKDKKPVPIVDRQAKDGDRQSHIMVARCGEMTQSQIHALKRTRDSLARSAAMRGVAEDVRAEVVADIDRAIADLEKKEKE